MKSFRAEATDEQSTRLGVVRETFSRWLNQPDWGRGNDKSPTETVDYSVLQRALSAEVDLIANKWLKFWQSRSMNLLRQA